MAIAGEPCTCCGEPVEGGYASFDPELRGIVDSQCQLLLMLAKQYLENAKIKNCTQVSGGKPLRRA